MSGKGTGLVIRHDIRNERYLMRDALLASRDLTYKTPSDDAPTPVPFEPRSVKWRAYWWGDQGNTPRCTAFGTLHLLAAGPVSHAGQNPAYDPQRLYEAIQAQDRSQGYDFGVDGGATSVAAHEVARRAGWYGAYYWGYTLATAQEGIARAPLVFGTNWYDSMYSRDAEGIIRIAANSPTDGGHFYTVNGYDHKRGLWRIYQTWGDGYYFIGDDDLHRLIREGGEFALVTETRGKLPPLQAGTV